MNREYFLLYLIYGFAMINMGIFSLKQKDTRVINLSLVKSLKYLGYFGVSHGITEWTTMFIGVNLYPELSTLIFNLNQILKAASFGLLIYFGIDLLPIKDKLKQILCMFSILLFLINLAGYIALAAEYGMDYHILNSKYNIITMRYTMALTSGIISAAALYLNAGMIEKTKSAAMAKRYRSLAWVFLIYGLLEGLLVKEDYFFPANIINRDHFFEYFRFPTLTIKAVVGLVINYLLIKVIDTFSWEQEERLRRLEKHRIASEERRKLGMEIHDSVIQGLYAAGLKVEYLSMNKNGDKTRDILEEVKRDLNDTIDKTREFISSNALDFIELEDLSICLKQLIQKYNVSQDIKISLKNEISPLNLGQLSPEKSTQIYYIVQEAICNITKHSKASCANVMLKAKGGFLYIDIVDDGIGISIENLNSDKHFGISSMKERTERVDGFFNIVRLKNGTKIELKIPWEEMKHEGKNKSVVNR